MTTDILSSTNTCEADEGCIAEAINEFEATQATKQYYDTYSTLTMLMLCHGYSLETNML